MNVLAYLDPGSGSMLLQMLLGGVAGIAVSIKMFGKRIFRTLAFWKRHDEDEPAPPAPASQKETAPAPQPETEKEPV